MSRLLEMYNYKLRTRLENSFRIQNTFTVQRPSVIKIMAMKARGEWTAELGLDNVANKETPSLPLPRTADQHSLTHLLFNIYVVWRVLVFIGIYAICAYFSKHNSPPLPLSFPRSFPRGSCRSPGATLNPVVVTSQRFDLNLIHLSLCN